MSNAPAGIRTRGAQRWSASGPRIDPTMPPAIIRSDSAPKMTVELHPSSSCMGLRKTPAAKEAPPTAKKPCMEASATCHQPKKMRGAVVVAGVVMVLHGWCRVGSRHECNRCSGTPLPPSRCRRLLRPDTVSLRHGEALVGGDKEGGVRESCIGVQADQPRGGWRENPRETIQLVFGCPPRSYGLIRKQSLSQLRIVVKQCPGPAMGCFQTIALSSYEGAIVVANNSCAAAGQVPKRLRGACSYPDTGRQPHQCRECRYVMVSDCRRRRYSWNLLSRAGLERKAPLRAVVIVVLVRCCTPRWIMQ